MSDDYKELRKFIREMILSHLSIPDDVLSTKDDNDIIIDDEGDLDLVDNNSHDNIV